MDKEIVYLEKYLPKEKLETGIQRLQQGEPVQYIVGEVNFYSNIIKVNPNVLIPRFETEELVDKTINYIKKYFKGNISVVDIGTGSGCIAISLKKTFSDYSISAVDISEKALEVARRNAKLNNVEIEFIQGNMLEPLTKKYDCIISNPPYIAKDEDVMDIVKNNEPNIALYADNNGLYFYEEIIKNAYKYLNERNIICLEIGENQGKAIEKIAKEHFPKAMIQIEKDMQKRDRFIFIFNNI